MLFFTTHLVYDNSMELTQWNMLAERWEIQWVWHLAAQQTDPRYGKEVCAWQSQTSVPTTSFSVSILWAAFWFLSSAPWHTGGLSYFCLLLQRPNTQHLGEYRKVRTDRGIRSNIVVWCLLTHCYEKALDNEPMNPRWCAWHCGQGPNIKASDVRGSEMVPHSAFLTGLYCVHGDAGSGRKVSSQRKTG